MKKEVDAEPEPDMAILNNLRGYLWPADDWSIKARVVTALTLLVASKVRIPMHNAHQRSFHQERISDTLSLQGRIYEQK